MTYTIYFDGAITFNPGGTARYGFKLTGPQNVNIAESGLIGSGPKMSNNLAEFEALAQALATFIYEVNPNKNSTLNVFGDSLLVINKMAKNRGAKQKHLYYDSYVAAKKMDKELKSRGVTVNYTWISRNKNQECDALSKFKF